MKNHLTLLIIFLCLVMAAPATAQTDEPEPHPLLQMLALVPDIPMLANEYVSYSDFRAAEAARPAAGKYESWVEYEAANNGSEEEDRAAGLWFNSVPGTGAPELFRYFRQASSFPDVMGFDVFDIDQALSFGQPPAVVQIFKGDFDADAITAARTSRGFEQTEIGGFPAWCSQEGCEAGTVASLAESEVADIFGGDLGRKQPSVLVNSFLYSSANLEQVEAVTEAYNDDRASLADNPFYTAVAEALTQESMILRQAMFISPMMMMGGDPLVMMQATPVPLEPLPLYGLLVIADLATEEQQSAVIALVYSSSEDAQIASESVPARLDQLDSIRVRRPWKELIEERGAKLHTDLYESENGKTVVIFSFDYPPASDEPNDMGMLTQTGLVYWLFYQSFTARDLTWLTVGK